MSRGKQCIYVQMLFSLSKGLMIGGGGSRLAENCCTCQWVIILGTSQERQTISMQGYRILPSHIANKSRKTKCFVPLALTQIEK